MFNSAESLQIAIVGGGITALASAYNLEKLATELGLKIQITIFEKESEPGGKIRSAKRGDFLVEFGPDSVATRQPAVMKLVNELGMASQVVVPKQRKFSIMKNGAMQAVDLSLLAPFPKNLKGLFGTKLVSLRGKIRACIGGALFWISADRFFCGAKDQDLATYFRKKWGYEMSLNLLEPLFSGLYGGDLSKISKKVLQAQAGGDKSADQISANVKKEIKSPYIGFRNGISDLINALKEQLKFTTFFFSETVTGIERGARGIVVKTASRDSEFSICLLTTPAHEAAALLLNSAADAASLLSNFVATDAAIVSFGFSSVKASDAQIDLAGSGVIVPASESGKIRGITISSRKWENRAPEGKLLVRVFGREGVFESLSTEEAIEVAAAELTRILKIEGDREYAELRVWKSGSALCGLGHEEKVGELKSRLRAIPGLFIAGAPYGGVGIGDCIASASKIAEEIIKYLNECPQLAGEILNLENENAVCPG